MNRGDVLAPLLQEPFFLQDVRDLLENLIARPHLPRRFGISLAELSQAFPGDEIGFCLDTGHAVLTGLDLSAEISAAGRRLLSTHIASNDGLADKHWLPNTGVLSWESIRRCLIEGGYEGRYVFELLGGADPDEVLRQAAALTSAGTTQA